MSEITRNQAIQIVEDIRTAISAGSVTNTLEARVLEYCVVVLGRRIEETGQSGYIENLPDIVAFLAGFSSPTTLRVLLNAITEKIPAEASDSNKLADKAFVTGLTDALQTAVDTITEKIPAEASDSNKLADKAFVTDLTDALQNAVNIINDNIGNGYVYAGIATPSGTPVSGKVFYLARQAGQYTNFGGLTVTEGINILKRNGSAWTQEQLVSMADIRKNPLIGYYECDTAGDTAAKAVTAAGYVLPATGGSVKIKMANRNTVANATLNINSTGAKPLYYNGQRAGAGNTWNTNEIIEVFYDGANYQAYNVAGSNGDGVFDISAYNLTNGQPTPYEDLEAALGPGGEHVPQSLHKGGVSVKFIQGNAQDPGNEYVQYRLMADEWSTTVSDWQGVDDEPTAGSDNLVKSGGTEEYIRTVIQNGLVVLHPIGLLELGNITMDDNGWSYTDAVTRIRTKQGVTIHLRKGDIIKLTDYEDLMFQVGWKIGDVYKYTNWKYSDYTVTEDGDYVILFKNITEAQMSFEEDGNLLELKIYGTPKTSIISKTDDVKVPTSAAVYNIVAPNYAHVSFQINDVTVSKSGNTITLVVPTVTPDSVNFGYIKKLDGSTTNIKGTNTGSNTYAIENNKNLCVDYGTGNVTIENDDNIGDKILLFRNAGGVIDRSTGLLADFIRTRRISVNENNISNNNTKIASLAKILSILYDGEAAVGTTLFDKTQVNPGDLIYVRVKIIAGQFNFDFFNDSDQVIAEYKSSGAQSGDVIERYITIPQGFSYAKTKWQKENYYIDGFRNVIPKEIADINDRFGNAVSYNIDADTFEIGSIAISTSGWSYSSSTQRIRTKQNTSLHLYPGTVVKTMPYLYSVTPSASRYEFYIGWKNGNAEYKTEGSWLTSFVVQEEGDYVLTMRNIVGGTEQTTTNADDLSKKLFIYSKFERSVYDEVQFNASKAKSHYKSINHRGYNAIAPQNTLQAFVLSKKKGFAYVETDIRQTSDGVYVLLHDASINNVARNIDGTTISETVNIADITYNEALGYDFGIAKGNEFAGTPIARFDDFLALCRNLGLSAYLDLKLFTENYIDGVVKLVRGYGMENQCTFLGNLEQLQFVKARLAKARLGVIATDLSTTVVDNAISLRDSENEVFVDIQNFSGSTDLDAAFDYAKSNGVPVEAWVRNEGYVTTQFDSYISGITTDSENYTEQYMDIELRKFYPIV